MIEQRRCIAPFVGSAFHVLLTCIQREFWPLVYPKSELPGVTIIQGLTGYVPERLVNRHLHVAPLDERKTWVAYRGRDIGARYGRLGFEKYEIGRRMIEICAAQGIPYDIAMDDSSRIYGDAWYNFLGSSRTDAWLGERLQRVRFRWPPGRRNQCVYGRASTSLQRITS